MYLFENGKIYYDETIVTEEEKLISLKVEELPETPEVEGKIGYPVANIENKKITFNYIDIPKTTQARELRERAYINEKKITWEEKKITVDEATKLYLAYFTEGNQEADLIRPKIIEAKQSIRVQYPD